MQFSHYQGPRPTPIQNQWSYPNTMRPPLPPQISVQNVPLIKKQHTSSMNQFPTNLNYSINTSPQTPQAHLVPSNNKLDINLNINVNNDGSIVASTGQATPVAVHSSEPPFIPVGSTARSGTSFGMSRVPVGDPFPNGQPMTIPLSLTTLGQPLPKRPLSSQGIYGKGPSFTTGMPPFQTLSPSFMAPQTRPLGFQYGMLPPPPTSYVGYRLLGQPGSMNNIPSRPNIDTTIEEERVYCVICQQNFAVQDRNQHIKKHKKAQGLGDHKIKNVVKQKQLVSTRPIVEPQEFNIQYDPNQYILEQETLYSSPQYAAPPRPPSVVRVNPEVQPNQSKLSSVSSVPHVQEERFMRSTVISDQAPPVSQPNNLYNRETLQSVDNEGHYMNENKDVPLNTPMDPIEEEAHDLKNNAAQVYNSVRQSQNKSAQLYQNAQFQQG